MDIGQTHRATVMNIPVAGSLLQRFFVSGGAAAVVVLAACCVAAAPNPSQVDNDNPTPGAPRDLDNATVRRISALSQVASVLPVISAPTQLDSARGDRATHVPSSLTRPVHW